MSIIIGADVVPTKSNEHLFISADIDLIGEDLRDILRKSDYRIFNLEVPLTEKVSPIKKSGPHLIANPATIAGYKMLGTDLVTISNNHALDQGDSGLFSTIDTLIKNEINYVGAGKDRIHAKKPFVFEIKGKKYGVYACCESEFSVTGENSAGCNPFDPLYSLDDVFELKKECDFVIVLYHGGKEYYPYPSPLLQKRCRRFIEKGADIVLCQHSHTVGCEEDYLGGKIVYGQGNFIFDDSDRQEWQTGLLVRIDDESNIDYIPVCKVGEKVRLADADKAKEIIGDFKERSEKIKKEGFVEQEYKKFAFKMQKYYLGILTGERTFFEKVLNKLTFGKYAQKRFAKKYGEKTLLSLKNAIVCEAHEELFVEGLKEIIYKD